MALVVLCACQTPERRAQEHAEAFARLGPQEQRLVLSGQIVEGLSEEAVIIALGEPSRIESGKLDGAPVVTWIYQRLRTTQVPRYIQVPLVDNQGRVYTISQYEPVIQHDMVPDRAVYFREGKVIGEQQF